MSRVAELAARLDEARRTGVAVPQLTSSEALDLADAYDVQRAGVALRAAAGERVNGVKLGFTSRAKAVQMGVDDVIIGVLTDAMEVPAGEVLDLAAGVHPRVEPEVAFRLARAVDPTAPDADLRAAVDAVAPALEVIDSRYRDFRFALADVVADNTSASAYVLGAWQPVVQGDGGPVGLADRAVTLSVDGVVVEQGSTTDILGDPWEAVPAVLRMAAQHGQELPAGGVILAGAATAAVALGPGSTVVAEVAGLGRVMLQTAPADVPVVGS